MFFSALRYVHRTVNHRQCFVNSQGIHTNRIESVSVSVSVSFISAPPQEKQKEINKHIGLCKKKKKEEATKR